MLRRSRSFASSTKLAVRVVVVFWALYLVYRVLIDILGSSRENLFDPALCVALFVGFLMSFGYCALLALGSRRGLTFAALAAAVLSVPLSALYAFIEIAMFFAFSPSLRAAPPPHTLQDGTVVTANIDGETTFHYPDGRIAKVIKLPDQRAELWSQALQMIARNTFGWYFFYFGLGTLFVSLLVAEKVRKDEMRLSHLERLAQLSKMEALRYQINPHFLFNTMNALSATILAGRNKSAESMVLKLSKFYRRTLTIDPAEDISLREELNLQQLYIDIESIRFPDRIALRYDVEEALDSAHLPALILQPLIENAIKHGVATLEDKAEIRISASTKDRGTMLLLIENDTSAKPRSVSEGTGTGIKNVRERLQSRFGSQASCEAALVSPTLFRVAIRLPVIK